MIWAETRYIGCSYETCSSIVDEEGVVHTDALYVVCQFQYSVPKFDHDQKFARIL